MKALRFFHFSEGNSFRVNIFLGSPVLSSVARGGGAKGGLEPPHWLEKYAKSHVFGALEADFLRKIENSPPQ